MIHEDCRLLDEESLSEDEAKGFNAKRIVPWLTISSLVLVIAGFLTARSASSGQRAGPTEQCPGFDVCPSYPMPYAHGQWPTEPTRMGRFPSGFIWGLGTASYQIEGAYREDGRGASIWDTFVGADTVGMPGANCSYCCKEAPCTANSAMAVKGATGNVACDHWHTWKDDIALMKSMGLRHYRFSIAWPRVIPDGHYNSGRGVNWKAINWYGEFIDALLDAGIAPYITLYHWDLPQGLLDPASGKGGWYSVDRATGKPDGWILPEWKSYVDLCFRNFGNRVKTWITFNEAWTFTFLASGYGKAPSLPEYGDMSTWPWVAGHNVLLAHAAAVEIYRSKYQTLQKGRIGITNNCDWREPRSTHPEDVAAAERAVLFSLGWFTDPIFGETGDYPEPMKRLYGDALPKFTEEQKTLLKGSADFFGLNHYGTGWVTYDPLKPGDDRSFGVVSHEGLPRGESIWLYGAGWGLRKLLNWVKNRYNNPEVILTEGGWSMPADTPEEGARDEGRVGYYANYTSEVLKAIYLDGCNVTGYFAWSLMDNFEWERGYQERFGVTYTDYMLGPDPQASGAKASQQPTAGKQVRRRKDSSCWLEAVWKDNALLDVKGPAFTGCVSSSVFDGTFTSSWLPTCKRIVKVNNDGISGTITCGIDCLADVCHGTHAAQFSGGTIVAAFRGANHSTGYWNNGTGSIDWGGGASWKRSSATFPWLTLV